MCASVSAAWLYKRVCSSQLLVFEKMFGPNRGMSHDVSMSLLVLVSTSYQRTVWRCHPQGNMIDNSENISLRIMYDSEHLCHQTFILWLLEMEGINTNQKDIHQPAVCYSLLSAGFILVRSGKSILVWEGNMAKPSVVYRCLFVEEEEVPMLPLHQPPHEQTPVCSTVQQEILSLFLCVCVCVCVVWRFFTSTLSLGPNSKFDPALTVDIIKQ